LIILTLLESLEKLTRALDITLKVFYGLFKTKIKARLLGTNFCRFGRRQADFAPILAPFARRLCNTVANSAAAERAFSQMNLQHTKVRNRLEPHRVEKLLFIQINKRQFRTEQPPKITQEFLLEEEDDEIERVLQRKQVQDHLSEGSVTSDTSSNPASSPTPNPTPGNLNQIWSKIQNQLLHRILHRLLR
ncbi:hypothetical protein PENANT_c155G01343, partial [Penicillium antarcticum]